MLHPILRRRVRDRVNRGIKFLNENYPGWLDYIDLDILDLSDGSVCILGQTNGGWTEIIHDHKLTDKWLEEHAFMNNTNSYINHDLCDIYSFRCYITYSDLTQAWSKKIEKMLRRENGSN